MKRDLNGNVKHSDEVTDTKNWLFRLALPFWIRWDHDPVADAYVTEVSNSVTIRSYDNKCCVDNRSLVEQVLQRHGIFLGPSTASSWYSVAETEKEGNRRIFYSVHVAHNEEKKIKRK